MSGGEGWAPGWEDSRPLSALLSDEASLMSVSKSFCRRRIASKVPWKSSIHRLEDAQTQLQTIETATQKVQSDFGPLCLFRSLPLARSRSETRGGDPTPLAPASAMLNAAGLAHRIHRPPRHARLAGGGRCDACCRPRPHACYCRRTPGHHWITTHLQSPMLLSIRATLTCSCQRSVRRAVVQVSRLSECIECNSGAS